MIAMLKNNINPTIGKFDLQCTIYKTDWRILNGPNKMCDEGRYVCTKNGYESQKSDRSLIVTYWVEWEKDRTIIKIKNIDLPLLQGNWSKLALTDLAERSIKNGADTLLKELEDLGILRFRRCQWSINKLALVQDFYTEEPSHTFMKTVKYYTEYMEYGTKGTACSKKDIGTMPLNEINFGDGKFELADKEREVEVLSRTTGTIPEAILHRAAHRLRYTVNLGWKELRALEEWNPELRSISLNMDVQDGLISKYLMEIRDKIPQIIMQKTEAYFGHNPWIVASMVQEKMKRTEEEENIRFGTEVWAGMKHYLEKVKELEIPEVLRNWSMDNMVFDDCMKENVKKTLWRMGLNAVVIPDEIFESEELQYFPCSNIKARIYRTECVK